MALSGLEKFRLLAPEFSNIPDSDVEDYFKIASERIDAYTFGDDYATALVWLAAHYLALGERGGNAAGPVVSEKAGEVSRSYGYSQAADGLEATSYGKNFLNLRRSRSRTHAMTTGQDLDEG